MAGRVVVASLLVTALGCGARSGLSISDLESDAGAPPPLDAVMPPPPPLDAGPLPPPPPVRVIRVRAGVNHACALNEAGAIWCWGNNRRGELGLDPGLEYSAVPIRIEGAPPIVELSTGHSFSIGLDAEGEGWAWGFNAARALLLPADVDWAGATPLGDAGLPASRAIIAGDAYGCAVSTRGTLRCWGHFGPRSGSGLLDVIPTTIEIEGLFAGSGHACFLGVGGAPRCWGDNGADEIGMGLGRSVARPTAPPGVPAADDLGLGIFHSCALAGGDVWCWGDNSFGQVRPGSLERNLPPVVVEGLPGRVRDLAVGWSSSCAILDDGRAFCWGDNVMGQLGDGTRAPRAAPAPVRVHPDVRIEQMAIGSTFACAVDDVGRLFCWGDNRSGQLGDGTTERRLLPVPVSL